MSLDIPFNRTFPVSVLMSQVDYFRLARNPSRTDAQRGDHFLQADLYIQTYRYRSREDVLESLRSSETFVSLLPELSSSLLSRKPCA
jgi:hypothetical protein